MLAINALRTVKRIPLFLRAKLIPKNVRQALSYIKPFLSKKDFEFLRDCSITHEEPQIFWKKCLEIEEIFKKLLIADTYSDDELNIPLYIHYSYEGRDWWIAKIDKDEKYGYRAWGLVCGSSFGYRWTRFQEIIDLGAELDFSFKPKILREVAAEECRWNSWASVECSV